MGMIHKTHSPSPEAMDTCSGAWRRWPGGVSGKRIPTGSAVFSVAVWISALWLALACLNASAASLSYTCTYDKLNRLTSVTYNNGTVISYTYDAAGNMTGTTVTASRSVQLTAPNGGESWAIGSDHAVTWSSVNLGSAVDILLSRDGGKTWTVLLAATADDGAETWTVTGPASAGCRVRVRSALHQGIRDDSDADFAIAADAVPPDTEITDAFCGGSIVGSTVTCHWAGSDDQTPAPDLQYAYRLDGGAWSPFAPATEATFSGLSYAPHTVEVKARDAAGNEDPSPAACGFTTVASDATPPDTEITSAFCGGFVAASPVIVTWTGSDNVTPAVELQYAYRLDGGAWSGFAAATSASFEGLSFAVHVVEVKARDGAGNEDLSPASCSFTVTASDVTPPDTDITSPVCGTIVTGDSVDLAWTGSDDVTPVIDLMFAWQLDAEDWSGFYSNTSYLFSGLTQGPHTVGVRARDAAGNVDPTPDVCAFTVRLVDATGDVNEDGVTDALDLAILMQVLAGTIGEGQPPCTAPLAADFNIDGRIDADDALALADRLSGTQPVP